MLAGIDPINLILPIVGLGVPAFVYVTAWLIERKRRRRRSGRGPFSQSFVEFMRDGIE